jgi:NAD(P)-dependent dehydrogenase (short-subunit alcohol dehydrogenase family)
VTSSSTTELDGRVAIVTGAAGQLGRATSERLARAGARVVLADLPTSAVREAAEELVDQGFDAVAVDVDVASEQSIEALISFVMEKHGRLDLIDNNAAAISVASKDHDIVSMTLDVWDITMAVNVRGPMLLCKHAIPHMIRGGGGSIVNISSAMSYVGDVRVAAYSCSKAALNALTRHVATAYGHLGIRCNAIAVGFTPSERRREAMSAAEHEMWVDNTLLGRLGTPDDVADAVVFLSSDRSSYITGQVISVDGGFLSHTPTYASAT